MEEQQVKIYYWLLPISWLYGIGVNLRNKLFDWGYLRSKSFDVPVICIGNIAAGGTGKTPHTEYLIKLLEQEKIEVAMLSRGYKRHSKGYVLASEKSDVKSIGDEPYQVKSKFPEIRIAVDEDRCHGIGQLMKLHSPEVGVVVLDDAFQHRYVKAGLNILLTDFNRLLCDDALLPAGQLREPSGGKNRAHIVIVTKCPENIKPIDFNIITKRLNLFPYQQLYFSSFKYGNLTPLFPESGAKRHTLASLEKDEQVLLVTGIASPTTLQNKLNEYVEHVELLQFSDHHNFSNNDLQLIKERFNSLPSKRKRIVTTEKDATRLVCHPILDNLLKQHLYTLPIEIEILQNQQQIFNQNIIGYVRTHSRNSSLSERKDAHTS